MTRDIDEMVERAARLRSNGGGNRERPADFDPGSPEWKEAIRRERERAKEAKDSAAQERPCPLCGEPITGYTRADHLRVCTGP